MIPNVSRCPVGDTRDCARNSDGNCLGYRCGSATEMYPEKFQVAVISFNPSVQVGGW